MERTRGKDTKTHQQRRITLDENTVTLLRSYQQRCVEDGAALGITIAPHGRLFSPSPDHSTWLRPSTVSQRFSRMCERLGWDMNLHQLRHYSATELISAGVDVRTVAGRLGHGGGGTTTLRVYSAWRSEADQNAAGTFTVRMPALPADLGRSSEIDSGSPHSAEPASPYQQIAADLRGAIMCGVLPPGAELPTTEQLKNRYQVSAGTVNRAIAELRGRGS